MHFKRGADCQGRQHHGHGCQTANKRQITQVWQLLLDKYAPHLKPVEDYRPPVDEELARTTVFRIEIEEWTGKRKIVPDDFPGAYRYEDVIGH